MFHVPSQRKTREERLDQIFDMLQGRAEWLTLRVIGRAIGLKPTPYLRGMLDELSDAGQVRKEYRETPVGLPICIYKIADEFMAAEGDDRLAVEHEGGNL